MTHIYTSYAGIMKIDPFITSLSIIIPYVNSEVTLSLPQRGATQERTVISEGERETRRPRNIQLSYLTLNTTRQTL